MNDILDKLDYIFSRTEDDCLVSEYAIEIKNYIKNLKEQLEHLRSNEYLNQVKWERNFNEELVKDLQQKIDKAIEYINSKIKEQKELPDYSKYYLENYDKAIQETHSSHSGILLETIKSTTIKRYEDLLEILGDKE